MPSNYFLNDSECLNENALWEGQVVVSGVRPVAVDYVCHSLFCECRKSKSKAYKEKH